MPDPIPSLASHGPWLGPTAVVGSALALLLVVGWPLWRLHRREGVFGLVVARGQSPARRVVAAGLVVVVVGLLGYPGLVWWEGAERAFVVDAPSLVVGAGLVLAALGVGFVAWCQAWMGASWRIGIDEVPTALVTSGPFRVARHPIYAGALVALAGFVLVVPGWPAGLIAAAGLILIAVEARLEERHMLTLHGEEYRRYAARVGRFLPWLGRGLESLP